MNLNNFQPLIPANYIQQVQENERALNSNIDILLKHKKISQKSWSEKEIEYFLTKISFLDSNNFVNTCPIGERESRIYSNIVARRHFFMGHGIGRSGNLNDIQPKAIGSSYLSKLTNILIKDMLEVTNFKCKSCLVLPVATGMGLMLCLLTLKQQAPAAKYVIFLRIDQKSCFKCVLSAGFIPVIIDGKLNGDEITTDLNILKSKIIEFADTHTSNILENVEPNAKKSCSALACIISTTSCFAPRGRDQLFLIGSLCKEYNIPHIVNNAYGLNSLFLMQTIQKAINKGARIDCVIQSCDKNFMVPVGGSIAIEFQSTHKDNEDANNNMENNNNNNNNKENQYKCKQNKKKPGFCDRLANIYPGRASITPSMDILITLLSMGKTRYKALLDKQALNFAYLKAHLAKYASEVDERVLETPNNHISIAMTLDSFYNLNSDVTEIGSMLFKRNVTGARVVLTGETSVKTIEGHTFFGWGSHITQYPLCKAYLTVACTLGLETETIDLFLLKLRKTLVDYNKRWAFRTI